MVVVLDTNVWVSAMHFGRRRGHPVLALERARNRHTIGICDGIEAEIFRILTDKFDWEPVEVRYRLNFFFARTLRVALTGSLHACRDPDDDMVLECAVVSGSEVIVTGDKDLLTMNPYDGIQILTPAEFLEAETSSRF